MKQGFFIGPLFVHYYGVIIMFGVLVASWMASKQAEKRGLNPDYVWDMLPWLLVAGIVGARIWHILTPPASMVAVGITTEYYLTHPLAAINIRNGGLGIPGAVMGGLLAAWIYTRKKGISLGVLTDIIAPGLAVAQAIGRWGNFVNQELYGAPTDLPWGIFIEPAYRLAGYADQAYYHPLFLYESMWNLANAALLLWIARRFADRLKNGDIFLVYLIVYPVGRFLLEFLRLDPSPIGTFNVNQTLMGVTAASALIALVIRHRKTAGQEDPETRGDATAPSQTASAAQVEVSSPAEVGVEGKVEEPSTESGVNQGP